MKQLISIKKFMFGSAQYWLSDDIGDEVILKIDYEHNSYTLEQIGKSLNPNFRREIADIAADLLSRKHNIDFAKQNSKK